MNNEVIARIDVSTPAGRKIARELENRKAVKMEYPLPAGISGNTCTLDEAYEKGLDKMSSHYGIDMRKLKSKL